MGACNCDQCVALGEGNAFARMYATAVDLLVDIYDTRVWLPREIEERMEAILNPDIGETLGDEDGANDPD